MVFWGGGGGGGGSNNATPQRSPACMYHSTRSSLQEAATLPLILAMLQNIDFTFVNGTFYTAVCIAVLCVLILVRVKTPRIPFLELVNAWQ